MVPRWSIAPALALLLLSPPAVARGPAPYLKKPDSWFAGAEAKRVAAAILSHQSDLGGWPKNTDTTVALAADRKPGKPTFDNGATTDELRFLARVYKATKEDRYSKAFAKGLYYVLKAQYANGGWPQSHPPPARSYPRHITFNDNAMVRLMELMREVATSADYPLAGADRRKAAQKAFDRGVECILKCQVKVKGKLTAWCAQHDEKDYRPRPGRSYELVSLSGAESVGLVRLLMSLDKPSPRVVEAVEAAVAWFESAKLKGIRVETRKDDKAPKGRDRVVVKDDKAPPLWARFYAVETNKPIFVDRDGVAKDELSKIGHERRNGYAWLGQWPRGLLEKEHPAWKKKHGGKAKSPPGPSGPGY